MRAQLGTYYSRLVSRFVSGVESRLPVGSRHTADGRPTLHLTFDDGPTDETPALLDVLARYDVTATFYLLGENAQRHPDYVRSIRAAGHAIGNHTMTHVDAWQVKTPDEIEIDFSNGLHALEDLVGEPITVTRPPFGRLSKTVVKWCRRNQQRIALWDVMPPDFEEGSTPERVARTFVRGVRPGSIVVLHDNAKSRGVTVPALDIALPQLRDAGWTCVGDTHAAATRDAA